MKSFIFGLLTILVLGLVGFFVFKNINTYVKKLNLNPSPSPTASSASPSSQPSYGYPSPTPIDTVDYKEPTTKGGVPLSTPKPTQSGVVKGVKTTTTTTTTNHLTLTLVKTSVCPISYMTEVKDIQGPLTLKYQLIDNTSFGITIWAQDGNELLSNTTYSGNSGTIKTISGVTYMKIRVESKTCASNNDNWLKLTAER